MKKSDARGKVYSMFQRRIVSGGGQVKQPEGFDFPVAEVVNGMPLPEDETAAGRLRHCQKVIDPTFEKAWGEFQRREVQP